MMFSFMSEIVVYKETISTVSCVDNLLFIQQLKTDVYRQ